MRRAAVLIAMLPACANALSETMHVRQVTARELVANPDRFIGRSVELRAAYCGNQGSLPGYLCSTDGPLEVNAKVLQPPRAKQKIDDECGGLDVIEKSSTCRVRIRFVPRSSHSTTHSDTKEKVLVIDTDEALLSY